MLQRVAKAIAIEIEAESAVTSPQEPAGPFARAWDDLSRAQRRAPPVTTVFDAAAYAADVVAEARRVWEVRRAAEHRSTAVFAALAGQLIEAGAGIDATGVVLRMAQDELRHGEVCAGVVTALGGTPGEPVPTTLEPLAVHRGCGPEERALRNVIYGCCLTEMVNVARLVDEHDRATDATLREALRQLLADEAAHARFGFEYLETWASWLQARPDVRASIGTYLRRAFAVFERALSGAGAPPRTLTADAHALGLPDPARLVEVFYGTVAEAVIPGLDRFDLGAAAAWSERTLAK